MHGNQMDSMGCNHHSHKCAIIEKYGNIEVGIERMGERDGSWSVESSYVQQKHYIKIQMIFQGGLSNNQLGWESHSLEIGSLSG